MGLTISVKAGKWRGTGQQGYCNSPCDELLRGDIIQVIIYLRLNSEGGLPTTCFALIESYFWLPFLSSCFSSYSRDMYHSPCRAEF